MSDLQWIGASLTASRPRVVAALLRYFRDLDTAEDAFQEASLKALKTWPVNGPPRDVAAWLIMVGRNFGIDAARRQSRHQEMPADESISDLGDAELGIAQRMDDGHYRDDILRLLFICCHPDLSAAQQIALALRVVSGLTVAEIARAFLVSETAMEQRITRAKRRVSGADVPFEAPGAAERSERVGAVAAMLYLLFCSSTKATRRAAVHRMSVPCSATRPSAWRVSSSSCSRPSRRSWGSPPSCSCSTRGPRHASTLPAPSCCSRIRTAGSGTGA